MIDGCDHVTQFADLSSLELIKIVIVELWAAKKS